MKVYHFHDPDLTDPRVALAYLFRRDWMSSASAEHGCEDGLARSWAGRGLVYCFPPSRHVARWARKIATEAGKHENIEGTEIIAVLPSRVDAAWMHDYIFPTAAAVCYWRGRLRALGEPRKSLTPRIVAYWGPRPEDFRQAFHSAGSVVLGRHVHRPHSWLIVVPRPSPTGTWVKQQGANSRAVKAFTRRFAEELRLANLKVGCPPATGPRRVIITRYSGRETSQASLERGGNLIESVLQKQGLIAAEMGYELEWHQSIDRHQPRTAIRVQPDRHDETSGLIRQSSDSGGASMARNSRNDRAKGAKAISGVAS